MQIFRISHTIVYDELERNMTMMPFVLLFSFEFTEFLVCFQHAYQFFTGTLKFMYIISNHTGNNHFSPEDNCRNFIVILHGRINLYFPLCIQIDSYAYNCMLAYAINYRHLSVPGYAAHASTERRTGAVLFVG